MNGTKTEVKGDTEKRLPLQKFPIKFREYYRLDVETLDHIKTMIGDYPGVDARVLRCLARH
jgi:hypothetical protein